MALTQTGSDEELATWSLLGCFGLHVTLCSDSDPSARKNCLPWRENSEEKEGRSQVWYHRSSMMSSQTHLPSPSLPFLCSAAASF